MTAPATRLAPPGADHVRVLLVDDQEMVRTGFRMILDSEPDIAVIGEAGDGIEAVRTATQLRPDVVLMDIQMPLRDGLAATRDLTDPVRGLGCRVVILTTFDRDDYLFGSLRAGASGFQVKNAPPEELVRAVRVVAAGEALLAPTVTRRLIEEFARLPAAGAPVEAVEDLTDRETEVLVLMGTGLANTEIAAALEIGEATVKTHVSRVLGKLGLRDRVEAVVFAYERGLVRPGAAAEHGRRQRMVAPPRHSSPS